jgi:hypothetical protein
MTDIDIVRGDALLLDAVVRGERPTGWPLTGDDELAVLLLAWRADLDAAAPAGAEPVTGPVTAVIRRHRAWHRRGGHRRTVRVAAAAALIATVGGVPVAAARATPGSPLWPITQMVNPGRVATLAAESAIDQARHNIADGRYAEAQRLLDRADRLATRVPNPSDARRLRTELAAVRRTLATTEAPLRHASPPPAFPSPPSPRPAGTTPAPTPSASSPAPHGLLPPIPLPSLPRLF